MSCNGEICLSWVYNELENTIEFESSHKLWRELWQEYELSPLWWNFSMLSRTLFTRWHWQFKTWARHRRASDFTGLRQMWETDQILDNRDERKIFAKTRYSFWGNNKAQFCVRNVDCGTFQNLFCRFGSSLHLRLNHMVHFFLVSFSIRGRWGDSIENNGSSKYRFKHNSYHPCK